MCLKITTNVFISMFVLDFFSFQTLSLKDLILTRYVKGSEINKISIILKKNFYIDRYSTVAFFFPRVNIIITYTNYRETCLIRPYMSAWTKLINKDHAHQYGPSSSIKTTHTQIFQESLHKKLGKKRFERFILVKS